MKNLPVLASLLLAIGLPQTKPAGPDPAQTKVIRPGKLIGAPQEAVPPDGGGGTETPGTTSALTLPAPLTAGKGLSIVRWTTFRRITRFTQTDLKYFSQVRLSGDGSKIACACAQGTFVLNADGSGLVALSTKPNNNPGVVDITPDGKKVVWTDINERELYVANSDGTERVKLPVTTPVSSARITADGKRVFVLSPEAGGILSLPTDGSDLRRVMTTATVCKLNGVGENGNHWRSWPSGLDISADGSRVVFHLLWDAFAMNGDGSGLRQLTSYLNPEDRNLNLVRLSGDGKRVATYHQTKGLEIQDWEGGNSNKHPWANGLFDGRSLQFSADGSKLVMGTGLWLQSRGGRVASRSRASLSPLALRRC